MTNDQRQTTNDKRPTTNDQWLTTNDKRPIMEGPAGIEPATHSLKGCRSTTELRARDPPKVDSQQWAVYSQQLIVSSKKTVT